MRDYYTCPRLSVPGNLEAGLRLEISGQTHTHLIKVLRAHIGDYVRAVNWSDGEWLGQITTISKRNATIHITERLRAYSIPPDIWLMFAPIKKARNIFIAEKATELGASLIQPVITARTQKFGADKFIEKLTPHIIHAAEQTERLDLPQARDPVKLDALLASWDPARTLIFADEAGDAQNAAEALANIPAPCAILIGPEGGFTNIERETLRGHEFVTTISLGPRILRADTAVAATLGLWQAVSGDWAN